MTQEDAGPVREPEWQEVRAPAQRQLAQQQRLSKLQGRAAAAAAATNGAHCPFSILACLDIAICTPVRLAAPVFWLHQILPSLDYTALICRPEGTVLLQVFTPGSWRRQSCSLHSARAPSQ